MGSLRERSIRLGASALSGLLFALSVPDTGAWPLAFVAWVPLLHAIEGRTIRQAFLSGVVGGSVSIFVGFYWMTELLVRFAGLGAVPAHLVHGVFTVAHAVQWGIFAALVTWLRRRASPLLLVPIAWVVVEAGFPQLFPYYAALAWSGQPLLLQLAEVGGVTTIGAVMLACNVALLEAVRSRSRPAVAVLVAVAFGLPAYGAWRMAAADDLAASAPSARIGVVQGNHGIREWSDKATRGAVLGRFQAETVAVEAQGVDFVLWGENVYPYRKALPHAGGGDTEAWFPERIRVGFEAPLVFGAVTAEQPSDGPIDTLDPYGWNSAIVLLPDGSFGDVYDKNHPLPFGEHAPLVDPAWYLANVKGASHINAGDTVGVLRVGAWRLGPLICYEDILPGFARTVANQGVHVLVNLTSDTWFGRSAEQAEHLGLAVLRAVEHRRALVRSVNTGPSAYVDPAGRILVRTEVTDPDVEGPAAPVSFVATVPMIDPEYRTLYARFGEWFPVTALVVFVTIARRRPA